MRKKLLIGALIAVGLVIAVGGHFFGRTNAQDLPKKAEPASKAEGDLFDAIKQSLEGKKEGVQPVIPPLPLAQKPADAVAPLPPLPNQSSPVLTPPLGGGLPSSPPPPNPVPTPAAPPVTVGSQPAPPAAPTGSWTLQSTPPLPTPTPAPAPGTLQPDVPPTVPISPAKIADDLGKVKDSPWTMHVEMVQGQTILTATVHQKHEFRIVCQSLDVQTGKGTLRAIGKVQITGDMLIGNCDQLAISLLEDRLLLEGNALVSIQKLPTNVSTERPAMFELKGATLDLRISELQSKFRQTSMSVEREPTNGSPRSALTARGMERDSKQWTPYGTLKRVGRSPSQTEDAVRWRLEDRDGKLITLLVARDGGTLAQFEGQNISVLGAREQLHGESVLRVTHVALP